MVVAVGARDISFNMDRCLVYDRGVVRVRYVSGFPLGGMVSVRQNNGLAANTLVRNRPPILEVGFVVQKRHLGSITISRVHITGGSMGEAGSVSANVMSVRMFQFRMVSE